MDSKLKLLFLRYFFSGRDDVYAYLVPGKGYRPRRRPKYDLTDQLLTQHMQGTVMLGAYPLLKGNMTKWIAADFDGKNGNAFEESWLLKEALEEQDITPLCNTSQSGQGVHVRVIFDEAVPAWLARNLMELLRTRQNIRSIKQGGAFDRFFPAQNELNPRDARAIGNQIGMPLHRKAAEQRGGCLLLDEDFNTIELGDAVWKRIEQYKRVQRGYVTDALANLGRYDLLMEPKKEKRYMKFKTDGNAADLAKLTAADLHFIVYNCDFMEYAKRNDLNYDEWWILASILTCFDGRGGRTIFHVLSSRDSRYKEEQANSKYEDILYKMNGPVKCSTLAEHGFACPQLGADEQCDKFRNNRGRGPKTPATICHFVKLVEIA